MHKKKHGACTRTYSKVKGTHVQAHENSSGLRTRQPKRQLSRLGQIVRIKTKISLQTVLVKKKKHQKIKRKDSHHDHQMQGRVDGRSESIRQRGPTHHCRVTPALVCHSHHRYLRQSLLKQNDHVWSFCRYTRSHSLAEGRAIPSHTIAAVRINQR